MAGRQEIDMLHGALWGKILRYALPVAATGILEQLFNASGIMIVGNFSHGNGTAAVAAVGSNAPVTGLILNLFIGLALGANVVIANAIGRNSESAVHKAVHTSVIAAVAGGVMVAIIGELAAAPLLGMLNVTDEVFPLALTYLRIYLLGMPVILLYNFEAAIFRSIGDTQAPLAVLTISGVLNVTFGLFLVIVCGMSVDGVALATVLANVVSSMILLYRLTHTDAVIGVRLRELRVDWMTLRQILRIGLPAGIQSAVFAVANIIIQAAINSLGTVVMAASSAAFNIEIIAYYMFNSFSQACATFTGQNYGARQIRRCRRVLGLCVVEAFVCTAATIALVLFFGHDLLGLFDSNPEVIATGFIRLVLVFSAYPFSMLYEVMSGYLRGFGISLAPAILTIIGVCGVRLTWIRFGFPLYRTFTSIMIIYPISLAATAVLIGIATLVYRPSKRFAHLERVERAERAVA
ncbi:MATE family efflux transporter [Bifidobacterium sp. 64T4]|uniref:MATE family efflux transporter n=1 Tax=Bifidobacterium pongonis TaxID=2834432 RepID=UPI001C55A335|nr:MATE family efflux transporter [Bifidobacterium pongonis]MBW3094753.1 MATE family efflux transporter [Bifidobacterium pongonis]